ncbi:ARM repeat superfamily protein [Actinidia rufa]|uniref:ARM repeat superfamily protein n=1 Tax=Actinidia rufa TaxID=165716 RepID=A0A7J0EKV8_9ERIC|nr:ARM repeat superfamily protein [Actinidia rufa]
MVKPKVVSKKQQKRGVDFKKIKRKGLAVSKKGLTLKELLQQTSHHNPKVRKDALIGVRDILLKYPTELRSHKLAIIEKLRERISDDDKVVRETLYQLLKSVVFPVCKEDTQGPFISLMMAYIFNAMTHLAIDVRLMAFNFFDLVLQHYPSCFSLYAEKSIDHVVRFFAYWIENSQQELQVSMPPNEGPDATIQGPTITPSLLKKLFDLFPLNPKRHLSGKDDDKYFVLNVIITEIFLCSSDCLYPPAALLEKFLEFIASALAKNAFTNIFRSCNLESSLKWACLSAIEEMLVPSVLSLLLRLGQCAASNPSFAQEYDNMQYSFAEFYCICMGERNISYGPFVRLDTDAQELSVCCLYYLSAVDSHLLKSLAWSCLSGSPKGRGKPCCLLIFSSLLSNVSFGKRKSWGILIECYMKNSGILFKDRAFSVYYYPELGKLLQNAERQALAQWYGCSIASWHHGFETWKKPLCSDDGLEPFIIFRMIEVLHSAYKVGHIQIADHISFFITLLSYFKVFPEKSCPMLENDEISNHGTFMSVTSAVCSCLLQMGDDYLVFQILEKVVLDQLVS